MIPNESFPTWHNYPFPLGMFTDDATEYVTIGNDDEFDHPSSLHLVDNMDYLAHTAIIIS